MTPTDEPPRRFKTVEELTVNEHLERRRTGAVPETEAYRAYRDEVLRKHGIEPESSDDDSVEAHARRKYGDT